jgi:hypothetical protein
MHKPARLVRFYSGAAHEPAALLATLTESALGSLCARGGAPQVRHSPSVPVADSIRLLWLLTAK